MVKNKFRFRLRLSASYTAFIPLPLFLYSSACRASWGVSVQVIGNLGSTLFTMPSGVTGPVRPHCAPRTLPACAAAAEIKRGGGWRRSQAPQTRRQDFDLIRCGVKGIQFGAACTALKFTVAHCEVPFDPNLAPVGLYLHKH